MTAELFEDMDRLHVGLVERVGRWASVIGLAAAAAALPADRRAAVGLALGGAVSVGFLSLHKALVRTWVMPLRRRAVRVAYSVVWLAKWPVLGIVFYWALKGGWVAPVWLCVGVGLVPAVATALIVWSVLAAAWRRRIPVGVK